VIMEAIRIAWYEKWPKRGCISALVAALTVVTGPSVTADDGARTESMRDATVTPGHVFVLVQHVFADLDRLRLEMGRPKVGDALFTVRGAAPHNVLPVAYVLLEKANQRADEFGIDPLSVPLRRGQLVRPMDVLSVVGQAHCQIVRIIERLGIVHDGHESSVDRTRTPSDVIQSIFRCNRQLNLMMDKPLSPRAVYSEVSLAIGYVRSMSGERSDMAFTERAEFVPYRRPPDVYTKLRETDKIVAKIGASVGVVTPKLDFGDTTGALPSDVHELTVLILEDLRNIHTALTGSPGSFQKLYYPGPRFPSHVYQRVETLNALLAEVCRKHSCEEPAAAEARP